MGRAAARRRQQLVPDQHGRLQVLLRPEGSSPPPEPRSPPAGGPTGAAPPARTETCPENKDIKGYNQRGPRNVLTILRVIRLQKLQHSVNSLYFHALIDS